MSVITKKYNYTWCVGHLKTVSDDTIDNS